MAIARKSGESNINWDQSWVALTALDAAKSQVSMDAELEPRAGASIMIVNWICLTFQQR